MRATLSGYYRNLQFDQSKVAKELFDVTKQISSGQKIQYAYEDNSVFIDAVRLDNEVTTLTQVKQNSQSALQVSTNTDTTMNEMTKILDTMKVKLINAANETNTQESLNAIAAELRGLEKNLVQLANTSIDGKYIFSGSEVKTKPIDTNGIYQGNDKEMKAFIGSGVSQTYNINGADLFLGAENDTQRKITMNVPLINQTKLYPDVMQDENLPRATGEEEYITDLSTIRDLMGDNDTFVDTVNAQHHFYIRGTDHDGLTFKETISMRDDETVGELMTRIGEAYGNSPSNELVSVTINVNGQIEIEDKRAGSSKLDFHMVGNTNVGTLPPAVPPAGEDTDGAALDVDDLNTNNTPIKAFIKSDFTAFVSNIGQSPDLYDSNRFQLNSDFLTQTGEKARASTLLSDVLRSDVQSITFSGTDSTTPPVIGAVASTFDIYDGSGNSKSMQDLMNAINTAYDTNPVGNGDLSVTMKEGKIVISRVDGTSPGIDVQLEAHNAPAGGGVVVDGLPSHAGVAFDESQFTKEGSRLIGNVSQVVKSDNSYATGSTRLLDVADITQGAANSLDGTVLELSGIDVNGQAFDVQINLNNTGSGGSTFTHSNGNTYDIFDMSTPTRVPVDADEMTYQQLMDVMNMVITNNLPANATPAGTDVEYDTAVIASNYVAGTSISYDGKIGFDQYGVTNTKATFSLSDANGSDFTADASVLSFQSNNALEISDPKTDFFKQIDSIISSIEAGRIRSDGTLDDPRNVGVQNSIQALDDLSEHLYNQHSVAGVQSQTLQVTSDRTEMLIINTQILRSETLDVDIAQASLEMKQLELNYQAMLSTVSRISQLSLVNYL
jgi:flagellar hook-associated protein 3 FlgL